MSGQFIDIDAELKMHYEQTGCGDITVLLVPGWTMSTRVFELQFEYFRDSQEIRLISYDPRAQGLSSKTDGGHTYPQHGRDLHAFIEALELDRIVLGGWSFGCLETLAYVSQFGAGRLAGFIMLDGPPRAAGDDNGREWVTYRHDDADGSQAFYNLGRLQDPAATNREFAAWMLEDRSEANIQWLLEITQQTPDNAAVLLNATAVFLDYRDELRALEGRVPLWYLMRDGRDAVVADWARDNTPSARVQAYGEHLMFWERADRFNRDLREFVDACRR
ncbi:MAG: alpha/beta hydrolase [Gammaproteobacteria bacterium]|nr:MAG: alpha/beta hydrolase [Gammaproteobacteria bacterium]